MNSKTNTNSERSEIVRSNQKNKSLALYSLLPILYSKDTPEELAKTFKALCHPWAIKICEILGDFKNNNPPPHDVMSHLELAREIYRWTNEQKGNPDEEPPSWFSANIHKYVKRLEKSGIVETFYGMKHTRGGGRIKYVRLRRR